MKAETEFDGKPVFRKMPNTSFKVDETKWGYVVKAVESAHAPILLRQALTWFVGTSLMVAIVGLWAMPGAMIDGETLMIKLGLTAVFIAFASLSFWMASQAVTTEVQFDLTRNEIRAVAHRKQSGTTLLDRVCFDDVGSVFLNRSPHKTGRATLVLRIGSSPHLLEVAQGYEDDLAVLRDRIGTDLLNPALSAPRKAMKPLRAKDKPRIRHVAA